MSVVETGEIETYYEDSGDGSPIVFIHGAMSDLQLWTPVIERLSDNYRCIRYDVRGHGRTGGFDQEEYSFELYADDLDALIDALELEAPVLCGLSMGGMIAQTYAVRHDAAGAVVVSGAPTPELSGRTERFLRLTMPRMFIPPVKLVGYQRVMSGLAWIQRRLFSEDAASDQDDLDRLRTEEHELSTDEFVKLFGALGEYYRSSLALETIDVPALALAGEREPDMMEHHLRIFEERVPAAQVRKIPDAGHHAHVDNPDGFAEAVREFLSETGTDARPAADAAGPTEVA